MPLPAVVPVLSKKFMVPPVGIGETVAVNVTAVPAVGSPLTSVFVKTAEETPFKLLEMVVVVAVADAVVNVSDQDESDPDGVAYGELTWLAI